MSPIARPVKMSTKGQIVIPHEVRRRLGIKPGDRLVVVAGDSEAIVMSATRYAESLRGVAGGIYGKTRDEIDAYVRGERQRWRG
jgi:AbrB family looped-hinge helix DNA binding protein